MGTNHLCRVPVSSPHCLGRGPSVLNRRDSHANYKGFLRAHLYSLLLPSSLSFIFSSESCCRHITSPFLSPSLVRPLSKPLPAFHGPEVSKDASPSEPLCQMSFGFVRCYLAGSVKSNTIGGRYMSVLFSEYHLRRC